MEIYERQGTDYGIVTEGFPVFLLHNRCHCGEEVGLSEWAWVNCFKQKGETKNGGDQGRACWISWLFFSVLPLKGDRWLDKRAPLSESWGNYLLPFALCSIPGGMNLKIITITMTRRHGGAVVSGTKGRSMIVDGVPFTCTEIVDSGISVNRYSDITFVFADRIEIRKT